MRIDTLNIHEVPWLNTRTGYNIKTFVGDGCSLPMPANSYDIGFSNSVIEHVGTWEHQRQFAAELQRVAKRLWVQTPAYECPIEPHYMTLFIHYFPHPHFKGAYYSGALCDACLIAQRVTKLIEW